MSVAECRVIDCRAAALLSIWLLVVLGDVRENDDGTLLPVLDRSMSFGANAYDH